MPGTLKIVISGSIGALSFPRSSSISLNESSRLTPFSRHSIMQLRIEMAQISPKSPVAETRKCEQKALGQEIQPGVESSGLRFQVERAQSASVS
jgi:hypothetical protein